jgi:hypothetical protein
MAQSTTPPQAGHPEHLPVSILTISRCHPGLSCLAQ